MNFFSDVLVNVKYLYTDLSHVDFFLFQSITKRTKNDYVVAAAADGACDAGYTGPKL